jgi:RND family efflux transporter MFP subunit
MRRCTKWLLVVFLPLIARALAQDNEPVIPGYVEPYKILKVSVGEPGVISEMLVKEGDKVESGQVLARLDIAALKADLDIGQAEEKLQAIRTERLEKLATSNRSTEDELDKAKTDLEIKQAQVRKIEAMIENRTLRSPVKGVVTEIKRDVSESVSAATPHVLTVVQIDKLIANLFLSPERAKGLTVGQEALLKLQELPEPVKAIVDFVSPVIDPASGTIRVKFVIDNPDGKYRAGVACTFD